MSALKSTYVDHLSYTWRDPKTTLGKGGANNPIGIIGVESIVAKTGDQVLCKEGVETREEVFDGHIGHFFLDHWLLLVLCH